MSSHIFYSGLNKFLYFQVWIFLIVKKRHYDSMKEDLTSVISIHVHLIWIEAMLHHHPKKSSLNLIWDSAHLLASKSTFKMYDYDNPYRSSNAPPGIKWLTPTDSLDGLVNTTDPDYQVKSTNVVLCWLDIFQIFFTCKKLRLILRLTSWMAKKVSSISPKTN